MIPVSEQFLSIQGEGPTAGKRAIFLRTHACNLLCGAGKYKSNSRWTCDTIPVFSKIQKNWEADALLHDWNARGWIEELKSGTHLVITGGEPLMSERQMQLMPFLNLLPRRIYIEIETNGTFIPQPELSAHISQFNVSPKLSTSGMPRDMRLQPDAIAWHRDCTQSCFKFVVTNADDVTELITDYINPFHIPRNRVWLMPGAATRASLMQLQPQIAQFAQEHGFSFCSRLHILLYDQATGV